MNNKKTYLCQICGKPATIHYQNCDLCWHIINDKIDISSQEFLNSKDDEFYCDNCNPNI